VTIERGGAARIPKRSHIEGGYYHEGETFGQTDLREMQSHSPQRQRDGHLRKSET